MSPAQRREPLPSSSRPPPSPNRRAVSFAYHKRWAISIDLRTYAGIKKDRDSRVWMNTCLTSWPIKGICTDGCFYGKGTFRVSPTFQHKDLEAIFQHRVFKMLLSKGKNTEDLVGMLMSWRHSGFNVFCGPRIYPRDQEAMENLTRYMIRASFSQERMTYVPEKSKVIYQSKDGKEEKAFDALEWLAAMGFHIPKKQQGQGSCLTHIWALNTIPSAPEPSAPIH